MSTLPWSKWTDEQRRIVANLCDEQARICFEVGAERGLEAWIGLRDAILDRSASPPSIPDRNAIVEECAKVAEEYDSGGYGSHTNMVVAQRTSIEIADVLRAIKDRPATEAELHKIINNIQHPPPSSERASHSPQTEDVKPSEREGLDVTAQPTGLSPAAASLRRERWLPIDEGAKTGDDVLLGNNEWAGGNQQVASWDAQGRKGHADYKWDGDGNWYHKDAFTHYKQLGPGPGDEPSVLPAAAVERASREDVNQKAIERLQAIIDWADLALANPQEFDRHGVRNLDGPAFDAAREFLDVTSSPSIVSTEKGDIKS